MLFFFRFRDGFDIDRRIAYLSQAAMCAQSAGPQIDEDDNLHDLVVEIRDKLDVAQIQLATRSAKLIFFYKTYCITFIGISFFIAGSFFSLYLSPWSLD